MKKIGVLTQPLHNNYGGLLQAFALQKVLKKQGFEVSTVDFTTKSKAPLWGIKSLLANIVKKYILRRKIKSIFPMTEYEKAEIGQETRRFIAENIKLTQRINSLEEFRYLKSYKFDAYIVGSDQVWRPVYSPGISAFFLDFLGDDNKTKRMSYAASFGIDNCDEYSSTDLTKFSKLAAQFDAVSVREDSAVELCKNSFSTSAVQVLDPTMLLDMSDYIELVKKDQIPQSEGNLMVYVLDKTEAKSAIIDKVVKAKGLTPFTVLPESKTGIYPPVTKWLRGFMDAEFIVTDSFHGVAFSIIFNKPFIAIGNQYRGLARFTSILKVFGLQNRLVVTEQELTEDKLNWNFDYTKLNDIRDHERKFSLSFLMNNLSR